jgi:SAM-dependent methyltransferase
MQSANAKEAEAWSGPMGQSWVASQQELDTIMADVAVAVMAAAAPQPGARVMDIGCGSGAVSLLAADAVGRDGHVLATDISEPLLSLAASRGRDLPQMATHLADAETADWPSTGFDLAISRFGVMFFANPAAAFANIARALKPGGRMVFAAWAPPADNPFWSIPVRHAVARLGQPPRVEPNMPGPMGLCDLDLACDRLRQAGLHDVTGTDVSVHLRHPGGSAGFADLCVRIGAARRALNHFQGTPDDAKAIAAAIATDFAAFDTSSGAAIPARINLLTARAPV